VKLQFIEIELNKPQHISSLNLRRWILDNLKVYGDPLRWAITGVKDSNLTVEAIIITS
tara:strand:+ start:2465 stop:2638 length:174 start_codon:yes stop_codon:yes gene_type:complete